jgi:hypothetical protein
MNLTEIKQIVTELANELIPGWDVTCEYDPDLERKIGALAFVQAIPKRQLARIVVGPHPPNESPRESIAHELTHALISPLVELIQWNDAATIIEEQIVERLGKIIARAPTGIVRAMRKAIANPRANSPVIRKRISALAFGRRNETRKRMGSQEMAALAMEGGQIAAMEGLPPEAAEWIKKAVAFMAGGAAEPEPESVAMRDDKQPDDGKEAPAMREDQMPEAMRAQYRMMQRATRGTLDSLVRMRLHEARTVDGLDITPAMEARLRKAANVDAFEESFELLKLGLQGSQGKARSGVVAGDVASSNGAPSRQQLIGNGLPADMADHVLREYARGADIGKAAETAAMKYRKGGV